MTSAPETGASSLRTTPEMGGAAGAGGEASRLSAREEEQRQKGARSKRRSLHRWTNWSERQVYDRVKSNATRGGGVEAAVRYSH